MAVRCSAHASVHTSAAGLLPSGAQSLLLIVMLPRRGVGSVAPGLKFARVYLTAGYQSHLSVLRTRGVLAGALLRYREGGVTAR